MIYLKLFWEFFKTGLFAVGGGMATLPFLQNIGETTGWYNYGDLMNMLAVSESTPGPIGINMATYVGCNIAGFWGGVLATLGEILPSVVIVVLVSKSLERFRSSRVVDSAFYGLRPAVTGLIAAAGISVVKVSMLQVELFRQTGNPLDLLHIGKALYFVLVFIGIRRLKKSPVVYIGISAAAGILLAF